MAVACVLMAVAMLLLLLIPVRASGNKDKVYQLLTENGLSPAAACGVMANIEKESNFSPTANARDGAYGLCQWTGTRKTSLFDYCSNNGYDRASVEGQIAFLMYELNNGYTGVYNTLKNVENSASGAYTAGYRFCYDFERPANKSSRSSERGNLAKNSYWPTYSSLDMSLNGIVKGPDGKWAMYSYGTVNTSYTGIAENQYGWWRVENGYVNFNANSIYKNEYGWWKCTNGKVTFNETGIFENQYGLWYVENSKVIFSMNGDVTYNGETYEVVSGRATLKVSEEPITITAE